jgi:hypothetical protein
MPGPITAKAAIKHAGRFTCNPRIEVADAMAGGSGSSYAGARSGC